MDVPISQMGQMRCCIWRLATEPRANIQWGEVKRMWKKKLIQILRVLFFAVITMMLLTTKAC